MRQLWLAVALNIVASACTSVEEVPQPPSTPPSPQELAASYVNAFNTGNSSELFSLFADGVFYSMRPLTWTPAEGPTEAVAAMMKAIEQGWVLEITDGVVQAGALAGLFTLQTHGPALTGAVTITTEDGMITEVAHDLDEKSEPVLESPYLYHRDVQPFAPLEGARGMWGELGGALYQIEVPEEWNGGLVIWGGGFKEYALGLSVSPPPMSEYLIRNGYAWAATSYSTNGIDLRRFVEDVARLHDFFIEEFGKPAFTYIAGTSMGGGVTLLSQQLFPARFDGALAICSVVGDETGDFFGHYLALASFAAGVDQQEFDTAHSLELLTTERILPSLAADPARRWRFEELIALVTGGPRPFRHEGFAEFFASNFNLANWMVERGEFSNIGFRYQTTASLDLSANELNESVVRVNGEGRDTDAYRLTGEVPGPLMMLHTTGDGLVPITALRSFRALAEEAGYGSNLVQRAIRAPGHCDFTPQELESAVADLFTWVKDGVKPDGEELIGLLEGAGTRFTNPLRPGDPGGL